MNQSNPLQNRNVPKPTVEEVGYAKTKEGQNLKMLVWSFKDPIVKSHGGKAIFSSIRIEDILTQECVHQTYYELPFTIKKAQEIIHKFSQAPEEFLVTE